MPPKLDILVISDLHYVNHAIVTRPTKTRHTFFGPLLIRKALQRLKYQGIQIGLIIILGDLIENGYATNADKDLKTFAEEIRRIGLPVLVVPGNHDGDFERFNDIFGISPGLYQMNGFGFLLFQEESAEDDSTTRPAPGLALPAEIHSAQPDLILVALQHNPLHPDIVSEYPYLLTNRQAILKRYLENGVVLSLSGHYHKGQPPHQVGDLTLYTVPAACEPPFRFAHVHLEGQEVTVNEQALQIELPNLMDVHCHTEFAYCATTVAAEKNIQIARALGLGGLCIVEHTFQLYFEKHHAWSYRWQTDVEATRRALKQNRSRMPAYRKYVQKLRSDFVKLGLEVDLCADGELLLAEEDWEGWDLLIGAVHQLGDFERGVTSQSQAEKLFMNHTEQLLNQPIQVLAHPFRFFRRARLIQPKHLYVPLAQLLAQRGVAAEVNFHTNQPDPRFIEACLSRGVKIALATDSHDLTEVGELAPHLEVLRTAGVKLSDLPKILFRLN